MITHKPAPPVRRDMAPSRLSGKLLTELQRQLNQEFGASFTYRAPRRAHDDRPGRFT